MKIALIGYGKMGKAIEEIALERGHTIVLKVNDENLGDFTKENVSKADVAIEFTGPHTAYDILKVLLILEFLLFAVLLGGQNALMKSINIARRKTVPFYMQAISA